MSTTADIHPNQHRRLREWAMWRVYFLGCRAHVHGHASLAAALWRVQDGFARGRQEVSVVAMLGHAYDEHADHVSEEPG